MYRTTISPRSYELDSLGHINNAVIASWFEVGRVGFVENLTTGDVTLDAGAGWVLASVTLDYRQETFYGTDVEIQCFPVKIGNSSLHLACRMYQGDRLTVEGRAVMVHRDPEGGGGATIPAALRERLEAHLLSDSDPGKY